MRLSDLQNKDIVNIVDGKKMGKIIDVVTNDTGQMVSLVVSKFKFFHFFSSSESEIKWSQIKKIGDDVILIDIR